MHSENMILMQRPQENHCKCHFLRPQKVRIIRGHPDKVHNYGYGSVRIRIATVVLTGLCRSVLVPNLCVASQ